MSHFPLKPSKLFCREMATSASVEASSGTGLVRREAPPRSRRTDLFFKPFHQEVAALPLLGPVGPESRDGRGSSDPHTGKSTHAFWVLSLGLCPLLLRMSIPPAGPCSLHRTVGFPSDGKLWLLPGHLGSPCSLQSGGLQRWAGRLTRTTKETGQGNSAWKPRPSLGNLLGLSYPREKVSRKSQQFPPYQIKKDIPPKDLEVSAVKSGSLDLVKNTN